MFAIVTTVATAEQQLDLVFQALADGTRRAIVARLSRGPASVSELAAPLKMSMPSVMQHLDVLQRGGLVRSEKVGRVRTCRLEAARCARLSTGSPSTVRPGRPGSTASVRFSTKYSPTTKETSTMSIRQHDFTIERRFRQTPAQTFTAFADPELKPGGSRAPASWTDNERAIDFRVGGSELSAARDGRGVHHLFRSRIHDIVDGERIVYAYDMVIDDRLFSVSLTTIEFHELDDGGTQLVFTEHGAFFDDLEDPADREHGTGLLLDALEAFLASEVPA